VQLEGTTTERSEMDELNAETREPVPCPECGEVHLECSEAILDGMALRALSVAEVRLSSEGMEALWMVDHAAETLPGGWAEAWDLAENVEELPNEEKSALERYVARMGLIEAAREELYEAPAHD
jgi:hypothetical protein